MAIKIDQAKILMAIDLHDRMVKTTMETLAKIAVQIDQISQIMATGQITTMAITEVAKIIHKTKVVRLQTIIIDAKMSNQLELFRETRHTRGTAGK